LATVTPQCHRGQQVGDVEVTGDAGGQEDKPGGLQQHGFTRADATGEPGHGQAQHHAEYYRPGYFTNTMVDGLIQADAIAGKQFGKHQHDAEQDGAPGIIYGNHLRNQTGERAPGPGFLDHVQGGRRVCRGGDGREQKRSRDIAGNQQGGQENDQCGHQGDGEAHDDGLAALPEFPEGHLLTQQESHHRERELRDQGKVVADMGGHKVEDLWPGYRA